MIFFWENVSKHISVCVCVCVCTQVLVVVGTLCLCSTIRVLVCAIFQESIFSQNITCMHDEINLSFFYLKHPIVPAQARQHHRPEHRWCDPQFAC